MFASNHTFAFYRLAGKTIRFDQTVADLLPFRSEAVVCPSPPIPADLLELAQGSLVIQADGWLADRISTIFLWRDETGYLLEIPSAGYFWTSIDGSAICQVSGSPKEDTTFLSEVLLGPPLVLALALQGVWCLHASAIEHEGMLIAFLGAPFAGKSTLANYLASQPGNRWVVDDILPVVSENRRLVALPHFPQLKIPADQQPGVLVPEKLPLSAIYLLDDQLRISIQKLSPINSALALVGHTVAARLFDHRLLNLHFNFCSQVVSDIPMRRLTYPHILSELPRVWQWLKDNMADLNS